MKSTQKLLGARIKELRRARKLSQSELSERIGVDPKHLSRIEVGGSYPSIDALERLARALRVEMKDFFEFSPVVEHKELVKRIEALLKEAEPADLRLIYKIIRVVVR